MKILAIETSCDDTCAAIIKSSAKIKPIFNILSNIVSSQVKVHKKYGGVYPTLAKREHQRNIVPVLRKALKEAGLLKISKSKTQISNKNLNVKFQKLDLVRNFNNSDKLKKESVFNLVEEILEREPDLMKNLTKFLKKYKKPKIDTIAVTVGPGLDPCLWVGVNFAKALSYFWDLPIIEVNHIEAHIFANWLKPISSKSKIKSQKSKIQIKNKKIEFPAVCLIASGGHTQLILMKKIGKYKILGETRDDAAGECFDKTAKILGLGYPGGPAIAKEAQRSKFQVSSFKIRLPRPMINQKNYDFSFSGLKTAVLYNYKKQPLKIRKNKQYIKKMCCEIQQAIIDVLIKKTIRATKEYKAKSIILGGGVSANYELRKQFKKIIKKEKLSFMFYVPSFKFCTDNAAMVGIAGYFRHLKGKVKSWEKIKAKPNLRIE